MLNKIKNKPLAYQIWATTVAICSLYCLIKHFLYDLNATDHLIQVFVLVSILIDYLMYPSNQKVKE